MAASSAGSSDGLRPSETNPANDPHSTGTTSGGSGSVKQCIHTHASSIECSLRWWSSSAIAARSPTAPVTRSTAPSAVGSTPRGVAYRWRVGVIAPGPPMWSVPSTITRSIPARSGAAALQVRA